MKIVDFDSYYLSTLRALHHQFGVEIFLNARLTESVTARDLLGSVVVSVTYQAVGRDSVGDEVFQLISMMTINESLDLRKGSHSPHAFHADSLKPLTCAPCPV